MCSLNLIDNRLLLTFKHSSTLDAFKKTVDFKLYLNRFIEKTDDENKIYFKSLNIHKIEEVIIKLKSAFPNIMIDKSIDEYIKQRTYLINKRYRIGNDIKKRDPRFLDKFESFSDIVNANMVRPLTHEQMWNAFYMSIMKYASNFSVPGSGKTATVLGTYIYLKKLVQ